MLGIDLAERRTRFLGQTVRQILALRTPEVFEGQDSDSDSRHWHASAQPVHHHDTHDDDSRETDGPQAQLPWGPPCSVVGARPIALVNGSQNCP
jgi:hypothetical protein